MDRVRVRVRHEDEYRAEVTVEFPDGTDLALPDATEDAFGISDVTIEGGRDIAVSNEDEVIKIFPEEEEEDDRWFADLADEDALPSTSDDSGDDTF